MYDTRTLVLIVPVKGEGMMARLQTKADLPRVWRRRNRKGDLHVHVSTEAVNVVHQLHHLYGARGGNLPAGDFVDAAILLAGMIAHWHETGQHADLRTAITGAFWECYGDHYEDCLDEEDGRLQEGNG